MHPSSEDRFPSLTSGNLWNNIWQLSWPIFLIMIFNFFVGITDIYVAGLINPDVQAVVGFISQIYFLNIIIANAISIGTLALIARAIGAQDSERATEIARQSLVFSGLIAICLTLLGLTFAEQIIILAGFPPSIRLMSEQFLKVFALSLGPNYILIISNAVFRASGDIKKPLITMALVSAFNIAGDFALVFGLFSLPRLGYIGIAVSTALSVTAGMSANLIFFKSRRWKSIYSGPWLLSLSMIKKVFKISWPAALLQIAWNAGSIVLYNILGKLGGSSISALASLTNGLRIEAIIYLPAFAMNMAASVLLGQNLGAGNAERAEQIGWKIAFAGTILISVMSLIIFIWAEPIASLFTRDTDVLHETVRYLRINMFSEPFMALSVILGGGLQGAGDTKGTMWIIVVSMWFIRLPLAYLLTLVLDYGATGAWVAMITSMCVQGLLMTWRFHSGHWKNLQIE